MSPPSTHSPETKAAIGGPQDVAESFDEFMEAFEAFKQANEERLLQVEKQIGEDVVTVEKMNRINAKLDEQKSALDTLVLKGLRPGAGSNHPMALAVGLEHKAAFDAYFRCGQEDGLRRFEQKAGSVNPVDGGYLVPEETATDIGRRLEQGSPIRAISSVQAVSSSLYKKPFATGGPTASWVGETDARAQTDAPALSEIQFPTRELYAMPAATSQLLDDAAVDIGAWLSAEVEQAFAEQESRAFVTGDGNNQPMGFLQYPVVKDTSWEWGKLGYVATGAEGGFAASDPSDILVETVYSLKAGYRQNANWVMNRKTQAEIRKLKDADGNYMWQPPAAAGQAASLLGFPVVEAEDMPDMATDSTAIAFGDFRRGYLIVDRTGIRVLRDPYSCKPYVLFYTTKRVGGGVQDFDAIKLIKFGTA